MTVDLDPYETRAVGDKVWADAPILRDAEGEIPGTGYLQGTLGQGPGYIAASLASLRTSIATFVETHSTGLLALAAAAEACGSQTRIAADGFEQIDETQGSGFEFLDG